MDRGFSFFDHSSLLRHSPNGANAQNSSPSFPPHATLLQQQQHPHTPQSQTHGQQSLQPSQQQQSHLLRRQQQQHQSQPLSLPHQPRQASHPLSHHSQPSLLHQQLPPPHHQQQHHQLSHQPHHQQQSPPQHQSHNQHQAQPPHHNPVHQQMQHPLHLQPMDSNHQDPVAAAAGSHHSATQQPQSRHQSRHQQTHGTAPHNQQHHPFQIHQLQQPQHQAQRHGQQSHTQHPQPSGHQQHQLSVLQMTQSTPQMSSLGLPTSSAQNAGFSGTAGMPQSHSQFGQALPRESQQQSQQHNPQYQIQGHNNMQHPGIGSHTNSNTSFGAGQGLQMQPLLPTQQPSQASFGTLNLPGVMLQSGMVDDAGTPAHHFGNTQSGDALSGAYPWDSTHAQNPLGSQSLGSNQAQQQPLLPLPMVSDSRTPGMGSQTTNQGYGNQTGNGQNAFGSTLNNGMEVLGPALNTTMVSGLVNGGTGGSVGTPASASGTDPSQRNSVSVSDGGTRTGKTVKKSRSGATRKTPASRGRSSRPAQVGRATQASASNTATIPSVKQPGMGKVTAAMHNRAARQGRGGKPKSRGREREIDCETGRPDTLTSSTSPVAGISSLSRSDAPQDGAGSVSLSHGPRPEAPFHVGNNASASGAWPVKKAGNPRPRNRRKAGDAPATATVPVHLRNPKKGRARVFRQCQNCKSENHIRRADCLECKTPLPAGKRRRDGNPSYDRKSAASSSVPNTHVVTQQLGPSGPGLKEEIAVPSAIGK